VANDVVVRKKYNYLECRSCKKPRRVREFFWIQHDEGAKGEPERSKTCRYCQTSKIKKIRKVRVHGQRYASMLQQQRGLCAICFRPECIPGKGDKPRDLVVYFNDVDGRAMGLICYLCNLGLQAFGDDSRRLARAVSFLVGDDEVLRARFHVNTE
jgi:hypothetical protein